MGWEDVLGLVVSLGLLWYLLWRWSGRQGLTP